MLNKFIKDECGATAIEYGLIAVLIAVVIIAALTLIEEGKPITESEKLQHKEKVAHNIASFFRDAVSYKYDERTGLCFAFYHGYEKSGLANVECTDAVMNHLVNKPE